jgi:hypothetical protein
VAPEKQPESHHNSAVFETDRAQADNPAFHQFEAVERRVVRESFELLGGNQASTLGHF